jgi:hypothetical protein
MKSPRWTVGRFRGAPVRLHLSLVLGLMMYSRGRWAPGAWVACVLITLLHELGHALLVARFRLTVVAIDVHALGGECSYRGEVTAWRRSVIAWGGVLAQALLLAATATALALGATPEAGFARELVTAFLWPNAFNIGLNLLPIEPLDGSRAWGLFPRAWARWRRRRGRAATRRTGAATTPAARPPKPAQPLTDETVRELAEVLERARRGRRD